MKKCELDLKRKDIDCFRRNTKMRKVISMCYVLAATNGLRILAILILDVDATFVPKGRNIP